MLFTAEIEVRWLSMADPVTSVEKESSVQVSAIAFECEFMWFTYSNHFYEL